MTAIVEHCGDAIWAMDLNARITAWNLAAQEVYGYRAEEVLGRPASILVPPSLQSEPAELMARVLRGESFTSRETERLRKSGEVFRASCTFLPMRNDSGEVTGATVLGTDITVRRRAEDMFRLAVEAAPNAMMVVDAAGNIVLMNAQTEKLFGYSRAELVGGPMDILIPPRYRHRHPAHRGRFMQEPQARMMGEGRDLHGLRKDGSEFPVEIGLNPIQTAQGTLVLSAIVDITTRKLADEKIRQLNHDLELRVLERTAELSAANADLESFSYSVAHDLRAPIRQIAGFSQILAEDHGQDLGTEAKRCLQRVQDGAKHMGNLVDELLNLARVSRQALSRRPTPLNGLIDAALKELEPECAGRQIEWQIDELWISRCDAALVRQVFANLLSNAVKFTRRRGRAVIQVGKTEQDAERVVFVRDNGAGFDMAYASKLFGVFQRLHKPQDYEGTGIGLANVQRIVRKHGGRIWAEAELDKGAAFFFTIPD